MPKKINLEEQKEPKKDLSAQAGETTSSSIFDREGELVVDVFETDKHFIVLSAIAGAQIKDIDISLEKDMMIIKGNRQDPLNHPEKKYFYQECYWGPFSRKIVLPEDINIQDADAQIDKGLLTIKIPKLEGEGKEKLGIKTS